MKGFYVFPAIGPTNISFYKDGYEPRGPLGSFLMEHDYTIDVRVAPVLRIAAGQTLSGTLFPDDNIYLLGDDFTEGPYCGNPCKLIRVSAPTAGQLIVQISWAGATSEFQLWLDNIESRGISTMTIQKRVQVGEEVHVYFGLPSLNGFVQTLAAPVPFRLVTLLEHS